LPKHSVFFPSRFQGNLEKATKEAFHLVFWTLNLVEFNVRAAADIADPSKLYARSFNQFSCCFLFSFCVGIPVLPISRYLPFLSPSVNIERDTHTQTQTHRETLKGTWSMLLDM
jgi:hypothetical protein